MNKSDNIIYVTSATSILLCVLLGIKLYIDGRSAFDIMSCVGSFASVIGFIIVIVQLQQVKKVSNATQQAVLETKSSLLLVTSVADISKTLKLIEQVQMDAGQKKYELALVRLYDIRFSFIQISAHPSFSDVCSSPRVKKLHTSIGVHLNNLYNSTYEGKAFNASELNETLENVHSILCKLEQKLKFSES